MTLKLYTSSFFVLCFAIWALCGCQKTQDQTAMNQNVDSQRTYQNTNTTSATNYATDYQTYKTQTESELARNQDTIASFRARLKKTNAKLRAALDSAETALERENADLREKIEAYKAESQDNWMNFKNNFDRSMDSIRSNINNFTVRINHYKIED
jgi:flagellar motility protein MotE (MotC chaperone)